MSNRCRSAYTLVELMVVISIVAILAALIFPSILRVLPKADEATCIARLHNLWIAFSPSATDPLGWPQLPNGVKPGTLGEQKWWLSYSSNNLGLTQKDWMCPTIARAASHAGSNDQPPLISYLPTLFDAHPGTANKWPYMPWFSEIGNVHGHGNLTVHADGSVMPSTPAN